MAKKFIIDPDRDSLNSDWLRSLRILKDKKLSRRERRKKLAERELEKLVPFDELEEK